MVFRSELGIFELLWDASRAIQVHVCGGPHMMRSGCKGAVLQVKERVAAFQKYVSLLHAVCNRGMRDRHWEVVSDETGIEVSSDSTASLKYLLDADIMESLPRLTEISDTASREWSIEKALGKMLSDWAELQFELADWKETGARLWHGHMRACAQAHHPRLAHCGHDQALYTARLAVLAAFA